MASPALGGLAGGAGAHHQLAGQGSRKPERPRTSAAEASLARIPVAPPGGGPDGIANTGPKPRDGAIPS